MIPEKIGRYIIEGELGRGAMGQVYRAHDPNIGRRLAIKTIPFDSGNTEIRGRFQREAQAAGRLAHPNIVTIFDAGEENGVLYIAMELVEGQPLSEVLASGPMDSVQVVSIGQQVADGLEHAHEQAIVHRDIKPANIMIAGTIAKVMDFGVARLASSGLTATGQVLGTPAYLPPEVIRGETADARSDIFALGVVLYGSLTGARPFEGDNISAVMFQVLTVNPPAPHLARPEIPIGLSTLVMKAIEKQPSDRFQSCAEMRAALDVCLIEPSGSDTITTSGIPRPLPAPSPVAALRTAPKPVLAPPATATLPVSAVSTQMMSGAPQPMRSAQQTSITDTTARNVMAKKDGAGKTAAAVAVAVVLALGIAYWKMRSQPIPATDAIPAPATSTPRPSTAQTPDAAPTPATAAGQPAPAPPARPAPSVQTRPAAPPALAMGTIQVRSTPEGARIKVDDEEIEKITPANLRLSVGKHKIRVELEGYSGQNRDVTIEAGENFLLNIEMKKGGFLRKVNPF